MFYLIRNTMVTYADLSTTELEYLRSKWDSEVTELTKERGRKQTRLNDRLNRTAEDAAEKTELENELQEMQTVLTELQNANASSAAIATIQAQVNALQARVDGFGSGTSYVSNTDAMLYQLELDEIDALKTLRTTGLGNINTQLGN